MVAFVDQQRATYGVESICRLVRIAPSTYFRHKARQADPTKRSARAIRDELLKAIIQRVWHEHHRVYGAHKIWIRELRKDSGEVIRPTGEEPPQ